MTKITTLFLITALLGLTSCTRQYSDTNSSFDNNQPTLLPIFATSDPDGDGDTKGSGYFPTHRQATGNKVFIFDPNYHAWAAYDAHGNRVNTGTASGGKLYCGDLNRACKTVSEDST
jgi:hypothetical protein